MRDAPRKRPRAGEDDDDDDDGSIVRLGTRIYYYAEVDRSNLLRLMRLLDEAGAEACKTGAAHVELYIHSGGGDAFVGLSAFDHIRRSRVPVWTISDGIVASAATLLLLAGHRRFALPHSSILVHQISTGVEGKVAELVDELKNSKAVMKLMTRIYRAHTNVKTKELAGMLKKDYMMTFDECVERGFVEGAPPPRT